MFNHLTRFLIFSLVLIFPFLFNVEEAGSSTLPSVTIDSELLQDGDLIFRKGRSLVSRIVLIADGNSPYSHIGIVKKSNGSVFVIHSVPAEEEFEKDKIKIEPVELFCRVDRCSEVAVYRISSADKNSLAPAIEYALTALKKHLPFDGNFDLTTDESLYCTELVWKAFLKSGIDLVGKEFDSVSLPFGPAKCILPGRILNNPRLKQIVTSNK